MDARLTQGEREVNDGRASPTCGNAWSHRSRRRTMNSDGSVGDGRVNGRKRHLHCSHERGGDRRRGWRRADRRRGGGTLDAPSRRPEAGRRGPQGHQRAPGARPGLRGGEPGPRSDPRLDARRRPVVRRWLADGVREPSARASSRRAARGARPGLPAEPPRDHPARRRVRARRGRGDRNRCAYTLAPGDGDAGRDRRFGPGRDRRCHRGAPLGRRPTRLRRERVPRAEDPRRVDPGGGRDAPARVAGGPGGGAEVRRAARARSRAPLSDRRRPLGSLQAGDRAASSRRTCAWTRWCGRRPRVSRTPPRGGSHDGYRRRPRPPGPRVRARPVAAGPEPVGQRGPLYEGRRNDHRGRGGRQRVGRPARERHRRRDPVEGSEPGVRALLPRGPRPVARDRRHRTGTRDRAPRRREPRRHGDGDERAGQRLDVRGSACRRRRADETGRGGP